VLILGNLRTACRCGVKYANVGGQLTVQNTAPNEDPRTLIQENHYDPWGLNLADIETYPPHNLANSPYRDWQQFSGKERDQVAYTEFEFRHYDPATGRFTSVDPLADAFTFLNPFNYADNNPTTMIDLYGLQAVKAGGGAAIQGAGGAAQATKSFGALRFIGAISGAVNLAQSLKQSAPNPIGAALGGFVGGVGEAVVRNIKAVTVNLPETIKGVASLNNPVGQMQAAAGAGMLYEKTKSDWNTGDIRTRSNIIGNIVGEAAIAFAGTKGVGNLVKAARVAKGGRIIITRSVGAAPKEFSTVLQSGGHTLNNSTLKTLGLTKEQGKIAIEALKTDLRLPANFHGKIMGNGDLVHPHTREVLGNLFDYLH
jgi:RHS repeat-associated protein